MLRKVLARIANGDHTIGSISDDLELEEERTIDIIQQLSRMGYVIDITEIEGCSPTACWSCPMRRSCGDGKQKRSEARFYVLTDKGRRVLG
ncbi:MAG: hypothetical protein R6V01_11430 [Thermoplasmatota archaeon]